MASPTSSTELYSFRIKSTKVKTDRNTTGHLTTIGWAPLIKAAFLTKQTEPPLNARYQRCALVQNCAEKLKMELLFLPPYSPNLNLIERLWKFVKKRCLYAKYYRDFSSFTTAIERCLQDTHTIHAKALNSLLRLNFQTLPKAQVVTA